MNLFCFTLEGSTESIYEPAYTQTFKEVLPSYQCSSGLLRCRPEWGGSDPSISPVQPQNGMKFKTNCNGSRVAASSLDNETIEKDSSYSCWMPSGDKKDSFHQKKVQIGETCKTSCQSNTLTRDDRMKELSSDRTQAHVPAQVSETAADTAQSGHTKRRLRKLQSLVQAKKGHQSGTGKGKSMSENNDVLSNSNPVLTCISLGKRTEKRPKAAPSPQRQQLNDHEDPKWSPLECPQPWTSFYHTCHQPRHELWACGGTLSLPRTSEWDRFESLIQELDNKQSKVSPPQMIRSITDLHLSQNPLTRFGRFDVFRQHSPLMNPWDKGGCLSDDPSNSRLLGKQLDASSQSDRKPIKASTQRALTATINGATHRNEVAKKKPGGGRLIKGHRQSSNSLESLYSGQSSSSGVTSGSDCSSNRGSLRLEDDLLYSRQFCGRARVHTDYVPSPYDTESLKLKVGDVIDIIARPPMGIWKGMLNGRIGNFKFIYVDVLIAGSPETPRHTQRHKVMHKSAVQEVLKHLSLEEYSSSLQLNGYQTVDDLMRLREHHLMELNVTDPEHRHRLLAAVNSLQQLRSDSQLEDEANQEAETPRKKTADMSNCSRDSGCHDNGTEDAGLHFLSEQPQPAEMTAS